MRTGFGGLYDSSGSWGHRIAWRIFSFSPRAILSSWSFVFRLCRRVVKWQLVLMQHAKQEGSSPYVGLSEYCHSTVSVLSQYCHSTVTVLSCKNTVKTLAVKKLMIISFSFLFPTVCVLIFNVFLHDSTVTVLWQYCDSTETVLWQYCEWPT